MLCSVYALHAPVMSTCAGVLNSSFGARLTFRFPVKSGSEISKIVPFETAGVAVLRSVITVTNPRLPNTAWPAAAAANFSFLSAELLLVVLTRAMENLTAFHTSVCVTTAGEKEALLPHFIHLTHSHSQEELHTSSRAAAAPSNTSRTHAGGGVLCVCPCVPRLRSKCDTQFSKPKRLFRTYAHAEMAASLALTALSGTACASVCGRSGLAAGGRAPASSASATRLHSRAVRSNASPSSKVRTRVLQLVQTRSIARALSPLSLWDATIKCSTHSRKQQRNKNRLHS